MKLARVRVQCYDMYGDYEDVIDVDYKSVDDLAEQLDTIEEDAHFGGYYIGTEFIDALQDDNHDTKQLAKRYDEMVSNGQHTD